MPTGLHLRSSDRGLFGLWLPTIVRNAFHPWVKENRSPRLGFVAELAELDSAEDERILWGSPQDDPETLLLRELDHAMVGRLMQRLPAAYREILLRWRSFRTEPTSPDATPGKVRRALRGGPCRRPHHDPIKRRRARPVQPAAPHKSRA